MNLRNGGRAGEFPRRLPTQLRRRDPPRPGATSSRKSGSNRLAPTRGFVLRRPEAVDAFDALGQRIFVPTLAPILGAEHLTLAGGAKDPVRVGRALRDDHQRALHRHAMIETLPGLAEV